MSRKVKAVGLFGDAREVFEAAWRGAAPVSWSADLRGALAGLMARAEPGDVVLLSPATASFDLYADYKARGRRFPGRGSRVDPGEGVMSVAFNETRMDRLPRMDWWLLAATLVLMGLGLIMVLSASGIMAEKFWGDKYLFFRKQFLYAVVGLVVMGVAASVPRRVLYGPVYVWLGMAMALLALTVATPLGQSAGGATRWLHLGPLAFQPLEFAKPALVFYLAYFFSHKQDKVKDLFRGLHAAGAGYRGVVPAAPAPARLRRRRGHGRHPAAHEPGRRDPIRLPGRFRAGGAVGAVGCSSPGPSTA